MSAVWLVRATKKGDLPIAVEKRGHHRVTVVRNVERPQLLLTALAKALGAGGSISAAGNVEVQGQLQARIEAFLRSNSSHLRGVRRGFEGKRELKAASATKDGAQGSGSAGDERRASSGKPRHTKARASAYVLAGANDDVVTATIRAAQAAGKIAGWPRCPHDWIYCTGRCQYPPSDDESDPEDTETAGSCRDLLSEEDSWISVPGDQRSRQPDPECEQLAIPELKPVVSLDSALQRLGMLACSSVIDDRGKGRSERKAKVAERRETRTAELQEARAARAKERRSSVRSWWPLRTQPPAKKQTSSGGKPKAWSTMRPQHTSRSKSRGVASLWEDDLSLPAVSRQQADMSDDIDRYLFGDGNSSDEEHPYNGVREHSTSSTGLYSVPTTLSSLDGGTANPALGCDSWCPEAAPQPPHVDAATMLREGGDDAVQALVAAENWREKFEDIIYDVLGVDCRGVQQNSDNIASAPPLASNFPWHVMAVRWLDGDSEEQSFVAALDTALREREEDLGDSTHNRRADTLNHNMLDLQVDEGLFFDSDDEQVDAGSLKVAPSRHGKYAGSTTSRTVRSCTTRASEWDKAQDQLIELGFDDGAAIADALTKTNGVFEAALELLCAGTPTLLTDQAPAGYDAHMGDQEQISENQFSTGHVEFRIDAADGCPYSKEEFLEEYGPVYGVERWLASPLLGAGESEMPDLRRSSSLSQERDWDSLAAAGLDPLCPKPKLQSKDKAKLNCTPQQQVDPDVERLVQMGFTRPRATGALAQTRGDVSAAMELLLAEIA